MTSCFNKYLLIQAAISGYPQGGNITEYARFHVVFSTYLSVNTATSDTFLTRRAVLFLPFYSNPGGDTELQLHSSFITSVYAIARQPDL